ncbi:MAG: fused MFS/spermidine synthase, partial [Polyangiaceae bacterium]
ISPAIFHGLTEYPLAMVLACLCRTVPGEKTDERSRRLDWIIPIALGLLMIALVFGGRSLHVARTGVTFKLLIAAPILISYAFIQRPLRFALCIGACLLGGPLFGGILGTTIHVERNFFGVVRVTIDDTGKFVQIAHGTTIHGAQNRDPALRRVPLTYYTTTGPVGQVFKAFRSTAPAAPAPLRQVAVIGLGAGTMAPYRRPNEAWTYFEIDPAVISIAENPEYFTYLSDAFPDREHLNIVLGDARLKLHDAPDHGYDLLVVDAFSSDSIPAHLLTREAIALYFSKLTPHGLLIVHISNRYLDLEPVFANLARDAGLVSRIRNDLLVQDDELAQGKTPSQWVVLTTTEANLATLADDVRWVPMRTNDARVWTDDFSNLLSVYKW